jgi:copper chaperone
LRSSIFNYLVSGFFIQKRRVDMKNVTYSVPNISCGHCVHTIQVEVAEINGVKSVQADASTKMVEVVFEEPATEDQIKALLAEIDYPVAA